MPSDKLVGLKAKLGFYGLRPNDKVAVKRHTGPVFHAIRYLSLIRASTSCSAFAD
ncbi:MAG: hypothetical protein V7676_12885 [Parasphingorhabdus sp.]|uniref:hypothetical protein n=1 Tax=Parasphingorhabdus sp. TaxID=2709688 RepID=UPI0030033BEA